MAIPTEVLLKRRAALLREADDINVRIREIDHWLNLSGDMPATVETRIVGMPAPPTVVTARNPRRIKKDKA